MLRSGRPRSNTSGPSSHGRCWGDGQAELAERPEANAAKSAREQLTLIRVFEEFRGHGYDAPTMLYGGTPNDGLTHISWRLGPKQAKVEWSRYSPAPSTSYQRYGWNSATDRARIALINAAM